MTTATAPARLRRIPAVMEDAMRLSALGNQFIRFFLSRGASPKTVECYELAYRQFVAFLTGCGHLDDVRSFTPEHVNAFATALAETYHLKPSSINVKLAGLRSLGEYGVKTKDGRGAYYLNENPLHRVYRPKRQRVLGKYLTVAELHALLAVTDAPPSSRLALLLLMDTALRVSELADATVGDLHQDGDRVTLTVKVKGGRHRAVTLGAHAAALLLESCTLREVKPTDPLLVNERGERYTRTTLSEMVARLARKAGITRITVRAHVLRHSVATLALAEGADLPTVALLLNHADLATVGRYVHREAAVDRARESVRRVLFQ